MIITCPECNGNVSDKASACPHCGFDFAEQRKLQQKQQDEMKARQQQSLELDRQKRYDAHFMPSEIYLILPWPLKPLVRPLVFNGRAPRIEFWSFFVFAILIVVGGMALKVPERALCIWVGYSAVCLGSCMIRRSHDAGGEGMQSVVFVIAFVCLLIPIIGWIVFVIMLLAGMGLLQESEQGSNKYGPNPFAIYSERVGETEQGRTRAVRRTKTFVMSSLVPRRKSLGKNPVVPKMIVVICPFCGQTGETDSRLELHQHVECPYCGQKFSYEG